ncbi:hypothetical protein MKX03_002471 [Papaver bracteatum]|nr:hypothetical protein MKX03_002471 [Papaver bracteatum]
MKTRKMVVQQQPCKYRGNICKILSGDNDLQFCDKHYKFHTDFLRNNRSILKKNQLALLGSDTPDLTKKKKKKVKKQSSFLPPDEERCCRNDGMIWRCKNFRMKSAGGADGCTKNYCEEHCSSIFQHNKIRIMTKKKKKSGAGSSKRVTETRDSNPFKRPGKRQLTDRPSTSKPTTSSDSIVGAGSAKTGAKRKKVERMSGALKSLTGIRGPVVETRASKLKRMVIEGDRFDDETSNQPATNDNWDSDIIIEDGSPIRSMKGSGEPVIELESVDLYKSNCLELSMELEKKKVECTELLGEFSEEEETRKSTSEDENAIEFWRKKCPDLESVVQNMEIENSTMGCVESRLCNLVSLDPRNGKESSILRCQGLSYSEKIQFEAPGLLNEITQTGESNMSKPTTSSDTIVGGGSAKFGTKRKNVERTRELNTLTKTRASKQRKIVTEGDEISNQPSTSDNSDSDSITEGGSPEVQTKMKNVERIKGFEEPVVELESVELYKRNCFELSMELEKNKVELEKNRVELENNKVELEKMKMELEKSKVELEKKKVECTEFQGKLVEVQETRMCTAKDENATEFWRKKCSDLESIVQRMENENSTMRCVESRVSNLVSLVPSNGKESSVLRCQGLSYSEKIESEARGLQDEITQTGENQRDENNMSKTNAETTDGGSKDSRVYELKTDEKVLNVEERKGWGCSEERPSQANLEMCKKTFVTLISDSNDGGDSLGKFEDSLGHSIVMLTLKNLNKKKDKMKWNSEADMLLSFEEDPELCLKAVCAFYRQEIYEDEISPKGLVIDSDMLRCITLAKFLMEGKGDIRKSVKELEKFDSEGVDDCRRLARSYSKQLFSIYQNGKDLFYLPATTAKWS